MVAWRNVLIATGACIIAVLGIMLGAGSQKESFLIPEDAEGIEADGRAAGNLVAATAFLTAGGLTAAAGLLSPAAWGRKMTMLPLVFVGTYVINFLIQTAWPNYNEIDVLRRADFAISPLLTNEQAVASTLLGPFALLGGAFMVVANALKRLFVRPRAQTAEAFLGRAVGLALFVTPFLTIAAAGNIRILLGLPVQGTSAVPYLVVLPLLAACCIGIVVVMAAQALQLGQWMRNSRLAESTEEAWRALRIAALVLVGLLAVLAILATALAAIDTELLQAGRTFTVTMRGHVQFHILLLAPLASWVTLDRSVLRALQTDQERPQTLDTASHPAALALAIAAGTSGLAAIAGVFLSQGAMTAWVLAALPCAVAATVVLSPRQSLGAALVLAVALWGTGNTIVGSFQLTGSGDVIQYRTAPGASALLRILAVTVLGIAMARMAHQDGHELPRRSRWPLAISIGVGVALLVVLELPFTAWTDTVPEGEFVGIGSVVASQSDAVQTVTHVLAGLAALAVALPALRIHRPDWFKRGPAPLPVLDAAPVA